MEPTEARKESGDASEMEGLEDAHIVRLEEDMFLDKFLQVRRREFGYVGMSSFQMYPFLSAQRLIFNVSNLMSLVMEEERMSGGRGREWMRFWDKVFDT